MRRNDVASTSFRRRVPTRFLINQCQIITFLILKHDIKENSRIELRGIVLLVQVGGLLGGPKGMLAPPLKLLGGPGPPCPPPPSSYAYDTCRFHLGNGFVIQGGKNLFLFINCLFLYPFTININSGVFLHIMQLVKFRILFSK